MTRRFSFALLLLACPAMVLAADDPPPNIVLIYADDLGYGDVSCYGGRVATPNIDRLATQGLRHLDAHCSAATCTPSRYTLLTGSYAFRQKGTGIQPGDANLIIRPGSATLPSLLRDAGYDTAVVGKWHLGLGDGPIDWNGRVAPGPEAVGFDYHFLVPATGDRVPCVYVEENRVVDLDPADPITVRYGRPVGDEPTGVSHPERLKMKPSHGHADAIVNGISRIGFMTGGESARWIDEDMADVLSAKAVGFIERQREAPFFLFFSTHDIHVPRVPHSRFAGSTGRGPRGDAIAQLDWCVGQVVEALERAGLADSTLLIVSSDNGAVLDDGYVDQANELLGDHRPSGGLRGGKYSKFEGGTRVPTVVRWPGRVPPGSESGALVGQVDWAASLVSLAGGEVPPGALPDSRDQLPALLGDEAVGRPHLVEQAGGLSLRQGRWKFVPPGQSRERLGPWRSHKFDPPGALFDLQTDPGEQHNVAADHPDRVEQMRALLKRLRSTPDGGR
ncbi:Arylsulfatase [Posidoniimonas corsicana]|uniref:Arylsulfatase n=1 Tax=Posidoniimonas corsicana TaxID=1938618 RepID=A0A5C5VG81_9BACT|nr:sulfatase-like hydrolase/transferase [Posidoniimonas corsicana]TWT36705.1 Arylsulfatase [Posidoniimonas corsicana]